MPCQGLDETKLAGQLATMSANQQHTTNALAVLATKIEQSSRESCDRGRVLHEKLGKIETDTATQKETLSNHIKTEDDRIEAIWRVLKWAGGIGVLSGGTAAGVKVAASTLF